MENIKIGDLYLSKKESIGIFDLLAKMRDIMIIKANLMIDYMKYLKSNLKIKKE